MTTLTALTRQLAIAEQALKFAQTHDETVAAMNAIARARKAIMNHNAAN